MKVLRQINNWLTIKKCEWLLCIMIFGIFVPIPVMWNIIVDDKGATVEDYMWYYSYYGSFTLLLYMGWKLTNHNALLFLFLLSWGKLIDQFYNPYDLHRPEKIWIASVIIYILYKLWKNKRIAS